METIEHTTKDILSENIEKLKTLFPEAFKEGKIDFDILKEELGEYVETGEERYNFNWNGKRKARMMAQTPSTGTLRPCKKESVNWDTTQNVFVEGDNLEVLKLLQKSYHKKIKMIYIDPPYNTGKDFVYKDNFKDNIKNYKQMTGQLDDEGRDVSSNPETSGRYHTDWLNMMYPRLKLARNLLRDDGVIFISIDDNEVHNLRKMCDEIFGEENFLSKIIIQSNKRGQTYKEIAKCHEYLLIYYKSEGSSLGEFKKESISLPFTDKYGSYDLWELRNRNPKFGRHNRPNLYYPIYIDPNSENKDGLFKISLSQSEFFSIEVYPKNSSNEDSCWRWSQEKVLKEGINAQPSVLFGKLKRDGGWNIYEKSRKVTTKAKSIWTDTKIISEQGTIESGNLEMKDLIEFPKPIELIKKCIHLATQEDDIVLDFFAGSATTAHAVMKLNAETQGNLKFIMVQLPEVCDKKSEAFKVGYQTIAEISKGRIRRAGKKIQEEHPEYQGDLGFKVFKLDSTNIKPWEVDEDLDQAQLETFIDPIKPNRTDEDLVYEVLLKYGLDLSLPIKGHLFDGQKVFDIGEGALIICLSDHISLQVVSKILELKNVERVVFKDSGFETDAVKINAIQMLKTLGIEEVKSI